MSKVRCKLVSHLYFLLILHSLVLSTLAKCFYTECNLNISNRQKCPEGYVVEGTTQCVFGLFGTSYMCCSKDEAQTTPPAQTGAPPSQDDPKCSNVKEKELSYVVALVRVENSRYPRLKHFCGGFILSPSWVLTSGRCLFDDEKEPINVNTINVAASDLDLLGFEGSEQTIIVAQSFIHETYNVHDDVQYANLALLYLTNPFNFSEYVSEISLPPKGFDAKKSSTAVTSGYQIIDLQASNNSDVSSQLKKFEVSIIPDEYCSQIYKSEVEPKGKSKTDSDSQICVTSNNNHMRCPSDAGGLLQCQSYACGVASTSLPGVHKEVPDIYTDVSYFRTWIEDTMNTVPKIG